jgi:hypothetical protein
MTNKIALGLAVLILGGFAVDYLFFGGGSPVFLGRKFADLIEWVAFWR